MAAKDAHRFKLLFQPNGAIYQFSKNKKLTGAKVDGIFISKRYSVGIIRAFLPHYRALENDDDLIAAVYKNLNPDPNKINDVYIRRLLNEEADDILPEEAHEELNKIDQLSDDKKESAQLDWLKKWTGQSEKKDLKPSVGEEPKEAEEKKQPEEEPKNEVERATIRLEKAYQPPPPPTTPTTPVQTVEHLEKTTKEPLPAQTLPTNPEQAADYLAKLKEQAAPPKPAQPTTPEQTTKHLENLANQNQKNEEQTSTPGASPSLPNPGQIQKLLAEEPQVIIVQNPPPPPTPQSIGGAPQETLGTPTSSWAKPASPQAASTPPPRGGGGLPIPGLGGLFRGGASRAGGQVAARAGLLAASNPWFWAILGIILVVVIIILLVLGLNRQEAILGIGAGVAQAPEIGATGICPTQEAINANKKDPNTCHYFNVGVDIFNTKVSSVALDNYILSYSHIFVDSGLGDLNEFKRRVNLIIAKSEQVGLNPVIFLGYWKTESLFGTYTKAATFGCAPGQGVKSFEVELNCAVGLSSDGSSRGGSVVSQCASPNNPNRQQACNTVKEIREKNPIYQSIPISLPITTFDDFAEVYGSRAPNLDGPGKVNNNCTSTYNQLVEVAEQLNACKASLSTPPPGGSGTGTITCPLDKFGRGDFNITCGTAKSHSSNNCGHGDPPYYPICKSPPYATCPYSDQLKTAIDVRPAGSNGSNSPVYLPFVNGKNSVDWTLVSGPISLNGGSWGVKLEYTATFEGHNYRLDLTHLDPSIKNAKKSGDQVGVLKAGVDSDGGHLHTAVSVDGKWLDAISEAHICSK